MRHHKSEPADQTGIRALDHDHGGLVERTRVLCAGLRESGGSVPDDLGALYEQCCAHFALEEKVMRARGDEKRYAARKILHEQMLDRLRTMMEAYENGDCELCDKSLDACLQTWVGEHLDSDHPHRV